MNDNAKWDQWLVDADSANMLAPDDYDDNAANQRVKALRLRLIDVLVNYEIQSGGPNLYQDSTGLAHYRVAAKGDKGLFAAALAWIVLSHFGSLAAVKDCYDPEPLTKIHGVLEEFGLKYLPYDYAAGKTYEGKWKM